MTSDRIKEIQEQTAYPESVSVKQALLQVWNECEQEQVKNCSIPDVMPRSAEYWKGFDYACDLLDGMGFASSPSNKHNLADVLKAKVNRLSKHKIRKNNV